MPRPLLLVAVLLCDGWYKPDIILSCDGSSVQAIVDEDGSTFWSGARRAGLRHSLAQPPSSESTEDTKTATAILGEDVLYGRPLLRIPKQAVLTPESVTDAEMRAELLQLLQVDWRGTGEIGDSPRSLASGGPEALREKEIVGLALAVLIEARNSDSPFKAWFFSVRACSLPALELTERQRAILEGTTVQHVPNQLHAIVDWIKKRVAERFPGSQGSLLGREEAVWALCVAFRYARPALQLGATPDVGAAESSVNVLRIVPLGGAVLSMLPHPDPKIATPFTEGSTVSGGQTVEAVLQVARSDITKGTEIFSWPGWLSNSDLTLRFGTTFAQNPIGIGGNISQPTNWSPRKNTPSSREFAKYNCSEREVFELRFSPKGWPSRRFIRCYRIAYLLAHNLYSAGNVNRTALLDKWPPPKKYDHKDWLGWTQADTSVAKVIADYCINMKRQLKESITTALADDFRQSTDLTDRLLWNLRNEESRAFKECVGLAKSLPSYSSG